MVVLNTQIVSFALYVYTLLLRSTSCHGYEIAAGIHWCKCGLIAYNRNNIVSILFETQTMCAGNGLWGGGGGGVVDRRQAFQNFQLSTNMRWAYAQCVFSPYIQLIYQYQTWNIQCAHNYSVDYLEIFQVLNYFGQCDCGNDEITWPLKG